jgi:hypothetical protein
MQALDRPVAPGRKRHAVAEDPVRMLPHNRTDPFHASPQVGPSQIPEIVGSQLVKSIERLGTQPDAQSGHGKMLLSQAEQVVTSCFIFMQHEDQARQIGGQLEVNALHFGVGDHADLRRSGALIGRLVFVQQDREVGAPTQAEGGRPDSDPCGLERTWIRRRLPVQPIHELIEHRNWRGLNDYPISLLVIHSGIKAERLGKRH